MYYKLLGLAFLLSLFALILLLMNLGRRIAVWHEHRYHDHQKADTHITEGAIFALLGLLMAFTFSSAAAKFDARRLLIIEEANAIGTAYLRLDLLPEQQKEALQHDFRDYLDTRLKIYDSIAHESDYETPLLTSASLQKSIWLKSISACHQTDPSSCILLLPSLNSMFDIANTRMSNLKLHPHIFLFIILIGLVLLTSVLAGYSISTKKLGGTMHYACYAFVVAITIYSILDMEYPRVGFIRVDSFDQVLSDVKNNF